MVTNNSLDWQRRVDAALKEGIDMDEQAEIKKVEEVTEYADEHPTPVDPATGLPIASHVTLSEVEDANLMDSAIEAHDAAAPADKEDGQLATADDEEVAK